MRESETRQFHVKELLAQDPEINEAQIKEFRMQLDQTLEACEQNSNKTRRRILIAVAVYLAGMVVAWSLRVLWSNAAPNAAAGLVRGFTYLPLITATLAAALTGIWSFALYVFKYAPQLNRARFDAQTSIMLELQQEMKQLRENLERRDR